MANPIDLLLLPIFRQDGQLEPDLPGLHVSKPPRRADRRRAAEQLMLYLVLQGNAPLSVDAYQQLLRGLTRVYYKTPGSVTAAMKSVNDALNKYLRDRNMRGSSRGLRAVGVFTQIILRENTVYISQSGDSHLFVINPDKAIAYHDIALAGRGLGISRVPKARFHQEQLTEEDILLITPSLPPVWSTTALKHLSRMQVKGRYGRLLHRVEEDVNAILVNPQRGMGEIRVLRPKLGEEKLIDQSVELAPEEKSQPEAERANPLAVLRNVLGKAEKPDAVPSPETKTDSHPPREREQPQPPSHPPNYPKPLPAASPSSKPKEESGAPTLGDKIRQLPIGKVLKTIGNAVQNAFRAIFDSISTLAKRTLPDENMLNLPSWVLGLIAVAVPIMVVVFASVIYLERSGKRTFAEYYEQAKLEVEQAAATKDEVEYSRLLHTALANVERAHNYKESEESQALYKIIRGELDVLDRVVRLAYQPLFSHGLGSDVVVSEMVVDTYGDLYLLNQTEGNVIRIVNNNGYEIDKEFVCGPILEGYKQVGPLVDIISLSPTRPDGAVILGIDATHTMILCGRDPDTPNDIFEDTSYTLPKGPVKAMTLSSGNSGNAYILDPREQLVLIEYQSENYHLGKEYFGDTDAPAIADAIDLAASDGELYLLHEDGHITKCVISNPASPPSCSEIMFSDDRVGGVSEATMAWTGFTSIKHRAQLGLRLYLLDPEQQAVYSFSPQLKYQKQFRPEQEFSAPASAFTIERHEQIFLAIGNQVYVARLE